MSAAYWVTGNTLDVLRKLPDDSIDVAITSPPFLALRSYLPDDDPAKVHEIGSEPTPGEFIDTLLDITEELRRAVAPHGSIAVELGDTYSGSGGAGGDYAEGGLRGWPVDKSLAMIPELYRIALAYGVNPLTGRETPRWRVRNVVRWCRPNPPVGALGDKFRPGTSDMLIATGTDEAGRTRYFDLDAVRETPKEIDRRQASYVANGARGAFHDHSNDGIGRQQGAKPASGGVSNPAGAPPLDWWEIPTAPYKGSHYATFPPALVVRPIEAMCPLRVCRTCGEPSRRLTETEQVATRATNGRKAYPQRGSQCENFDQRTEARVTTVGWTDCGHNDWRTGRVLDPFGGSGTTLAVATGHGRDAIGIDLDARNVVLAEERIGPMFFHHLDVEQLAEVLG